MPTWGTAATTLFAALLAALLVVMGWLLKVLFGAVSAVRDDLAKHREDGSRRLNDTNGHLSQIDHRLTIVESDRARMNQMFERLERSMERLWGVADALNNATAVIKEQIAELRRRQDAQ